MANFFIKRKKVELPPIDRQAERIVELKREIDRLNAELDTFKARENEISKSLLVAKELGEKYERECRVRYALEAERLSVIFFKIRVSFLSDTVSGNIRLDISF